MKNEQLIQKITDMSYNDLMAKVRGIRNARVTAVEDHKQSAKLKQPKRQTKRARVNNVDKLVDQMSPEEKLKLLKQ